MDAAVHRGLGGVLVQLAQLLVALADRPMEPAGRERWQRDQAVFMLAQSARESRLARARG
jgi:hypothetical protein